jgi:hypothetical protein
VKGLTWWSKCLKSIGDYHNAKRLLLLSMRKNLVYRGKYDKDSIETFFVLLGIFYCLGDFEVTKILSEELCQICTQVFGLNHLKTACAYSNLGTS